VISISPPSAAATQAAGSVPRSMNSIRSSQAPLPSFHQVWSGLRSITAPMPVSWLTGR
jgi:hypothetical protein